jgi:hypothetical protein
MLFVPARPPGVGPYSQAESFLTLRNLLRPTGTMVSVVSSPDIYKHEWASFTTKEYPENAAACNGDVVRIVVTDHRDRRPVEGILRTTNRIGCCMEKRACRPSESSRLWPRATSHTHG